jgi:hypothetical protein
MWVHGPGSEPREVCVVEDHADNLNNAEDSPCSGGATASDDTEKSTTAASCY